MTIVDRVLVLTDVVDSTQLTEQQGPAAPDLWARHDTMARTLLAEHGGREVDKSDGFLLLFEDAAGAIAFARGYHAALAGFDPPVQARVGVHAGEVSLRETPADEVARGAKPLEVDGLAKPLAARVMSIAQGGQTLVTSGAAPADAISHGHWQLKGVAEPVELFEAHGDGTPPPDAAKAWRVRRTDEGWVPVRDVDHHLPAERDTFVGRTAELMQLASLLDDGTRLVSLLGIGGTGKTRLALHYGRMWLGGWPGGVWFCDLTQARTLDGVVYAVARTLGVSSPGADPVALLGRVIAGRGKCLLILDNFEQVASHATESLGRWLDQAHDAQFVVTTREVLGLRGETSLPLQALQAPDAMALFDTRARQANPHYEPDRRAVAELAAVLDHLPLAIELAAARARVMSPSDLLARIGDRFRLLASTSPRRDRHATLRATLDWSWNLLSTDEQEALALVSVFYGGFTLEAAEEVLQLNHLWPADAVQALVGKSLVRNVAEQRFDLLSCVREYADEKLAQGNQAQRARVRHGQHYAKVVGDKEPWRALMSEGGVEYGRRLALELDNVFAACRRAVERRDVPVAVTTLGAVWALLAFRGPYSAIAPAVRAVEAVVQNATDRTLVRYFSGVVSEITGDFDTALARFEESLRYYRAVGDRRQEGLMLLHIGNVQTDRRQLKKSEGTYRASLARLQSVGDRQGEGMVLHNLGLVAGLDGRWAEAMELYRQALEIDRDVGNRLSEGNVLMNLGVCHLDQGNHDQAREYLVSALAVHREIGNARSEVDTLKALGDVAFRKERFEEAEMRYDAARQRAADMGDRRRVGWANERLGRVRIRRSSPEEALRWFAKAEGSLREVNDSLNLSLVLANRARLEASLTQLDRAERTLNEAIGLHSKLGADAAEPLIAWLNDAYEQVRLSNGAPVGLKPPPLLRLT